MLRSVLYVDGMYHREKSERGHDYLKLGTANVAEYYCYLKKWILTTQQYLPFCDTLDGNRSLKSLK